MKDAGELDRAINEMLVLLVGMVLKLSIPPVARSAEERCVLMRSVNQCGAFGRSARLGNQGRTRGGDQAPLAAGCEPIGCSYHRNASRGDRSR